MATELQTILKLRVPIIVEVGRRSMKLDDLLALGPGAIVELEKNAEDELELLAHNKPVGRGKAVKVGENFGIRVSGIGSPAERVEALAG